MTSPEKSLLAAELVLGLLPPQEQADGLRAVARDPELAGEMAFWQSRFIGFMGPVEEEVPSPQVFDALQARLFGEAPRRSFWQEILAPENRGLLVLVLAVKLGVLALLLYALF
ncbi:hypothetical protein [Alloyangia pacifica]|uniref:Anti-sigma factor n=1 Tax=Alloyangia pacifica TaxID=311180 RepID=A0A1I6REV9_9RHOB|nr:hypothetical protein [Alloyangia pacifica]SDG48613.1 hypothetical protein SAMN04488245_10342 [Alloyangia pacifica]SFS63281.1 hypothetical protein SAMN04488050_10342 [Alloyangia pacifica]